MRPFPLLGLVALLLSALTSVGANTGPVAAPAASGEFTGMIDIGGSR